MKTYTGKLSDVCPADLQTLVIVTEHTDMDALYEAFKEVHGGSIGMHSIIVEPCVLLHERVQDWEYIDWEHTCYKLGQAITASLGRLLINDGDEMANPGVVAEIVEYAIKEGLWFRADVIGG